MTETPLSNCTFAWNTARFGAGMFNDLTGSNPTLTNCTFTENYARSDGGGMDNSGNASATLIDCTFDDNTADYTGGGVEASAGVDLTLTNCTFTANSGRYGGGLANYSSIATLIDCTFTGNTGGRLGGGMYNGGSGATLVNCRFNGNWAPETSGGIDNRGSGVVMINCTLTGNSSNEEAAAMYNNDSSVELINCTMTNNRTNLSGAGGIWSDFGTTLELDNCILWGNSSPAGSGEAVQISSDGSGSMTVDRSCVEGGWSGSGANNISSDPVFVRDPDDGGDGWGVGGNDDYGDLRLSTGSLCIDAGSNAPVPADTHDVDGDDNTTEKTPDLNLNDRVFNGTVDMGAYEWSG